MATADTSFETYGVPLPAPHLPLPAVLLRWSARSLVAIVWLSSGIFGIYILAYYVGAVAAGTPADWNESLPRLYVPNAPPANAAIFVHFAFGAILLLIGPVQLMGGIRSRWPVFHRWTGRLYATAALATGLGGLLYILVRGTIGGAVMSAGFGLYGALMAVAAIQTVRFAMAGALAQHRAWAIRLFALTIGSWLYRMDYGFWGLLAGHLGRTKTFDGWFDMVMVFWFFVPNLLIAEIFIRGRRTGSGPASKLVATAFMSLGFVFLSLATFMVTTKAWGPTILWRLGLISG